MIHMYACVKKKILEKIFFFSSKQRETLLFLFFRPSVFCFLKIKQSVTAKISNQEIIETSVPSTSRYKVKN